MVGKVIEKNRYLLLLQVILSRATSLAARKRTFMILFPSVNPSMPGQVTAGGESLIACWTNMLLPWNRFLDNRNNLGRFQVGFSVTLSVIIRSIVIHGGRFKL